MKNIYQKALLLKKMKQDPTLQNASHSVKTMSVRRKENDRVFATRVIAAVILLPFLDCPIRNSPKLKSNVLSLEKKVIYPSHTLRTLEFLDLRIYKIGKYTQNLGWGIWPGINKKKNPDIYQLWLCPSVAISLRWSSGCLTTGMSYR